MTTKAEEVKKMSKAEDEKKKEKAEGEEKKEKAEEEKKEKAEFDEELQRCGKTEEEGENAEKENKKEKAEQEEKNEKAEEEEKKEKTEEKKEKQKAEFDEELQRCWTTEAEKVVKKEKTEEEKKKEKAEEDEELQRCGMTEAETVERSQKIGLKLTLWCSCLFKPLTTHDEIEPIMATLGFVPLPLTTTNFNNITVAWKEYNYTRACATTTKPGAFAFRPRLPYPRIDGLHVLTYRAFVRAIKFYNNEAFVNDHFYLRAISLDPIHDQHMSWVYMFVKVRNFSIFYREGTLDFSLENHYPLRSSEIGEGKEIIEKDDNEDDDLKITLASMDDITLSDKKDNGSSSRDHEVTQTP